MNEYGFNFQKALNLGANITGGEGGATRVVCDDLGNNLDHTLSEVDSKGAVVTDDEGRFQRLSISNRGKSGVEVHRGVNDQPVLRPGSSLKFSVGSLSVRIEATADSQVLFNGIASTKLTRALEDQRYPHVPMDRG